MERQKKTKHYTINLTEQEAELIERIALETNRRPAEVLRLLVLPPAFKWWRDFNNREHPENNDPYFLPRL